MQQLLIEDDIKIIAIIVEKENKDIEAIAAKGIKLEQLKQAVEKLCLETRNVEERKN